ncbi:hypothetical protein BCR39DRAFT_587665 [Naematelia encephala]|uniref:DUF7721 domain-containing protein n=1 Tax=Naematelia encephala TaxID=71784 RepID=A0A1Y2B858_9TREE|nr:hypothetical protein BCR39DRAFT_587665 [Naematelia encephala]
MDFIKKFAEEKIEQEMGMGGNQQQSQGQGYGNQQGYDEQQQQQAYDGNQGGSYGGNQSGGYENQASYGQNQYQDSYGQNQNQNQGSYGGNQGGYGENQGGYGGQREDSYGGQGGEGYGQTGGAQYNRRHGQGGAGYGGSGNTPQIDQSAAIQAANQHASNGDENSSLFSSALGQLGGMSAQDANDVDEDDVQQKHDQAYNQGNAGNLSANAMGGAAAMQALKMFTSGQSGAAGGSGGNMQSKIIGMAMSEAAQLFDQSGGAASGNKQDAVSSAGQMIMKLMLKNQVSGMMGGGQSGGLSSLMGIWMLIMSNLGLFIWASGWTYLKYKLGWTYIPGHGPLPVPDQLWTEHDRGFNTPLTFFLVLSYSLQISLNTEEALYWHHLIQAVRRPHSASANWLSSRFFVSWITISAFFTLVQFSATWIKYGTFDNQLSRALTCAGILQLVLVSASTVIIFQFPAFLSSVKTSGAGPEVRTRLHFYHELNKVRTFSRTVLALSCLTLGADGLTEKKRINTSRVAPDTLEQILFGSYFFSNLIGLMLYLPRNYASMEKPTAGQVFVGRAQAHQGAGDTQASVNLKTLLRQGGQWDDIDDARAQAQRTHSGQWVPNDHAYSLDDNWTTQDVERGDVGSQLDKFTSVEHDIDVPPSPVSKD